MAEKKTEKCAHPVAVYDIGERQGRLWIAPSQNQSLSESILSCAGVSGIAVAQGTHTGVLTDKFGCSAITAITLPATSGSGTPAISDWVTCSITGFSNGDDPHTVTAYQSPNTGDSIAVLANGEATSLAVIGLMNPRPLFHGQQAGTGAH